MKSLLNKIAMLAIMLTATCIFTACDEDDEVGNKLDGTWYGDLQMKSNGEVADYSEIIFRSTSNEGISNYKNGTGDEYDHYSRNRRVHHTFRYEISDKVIYMYYDNEGLDCSIRDYTIRKYAFSGWIDSKYTASVPFELYRSLKDYRNAVNTNSDRSDNSSNDGRAVKGADGEANEVLETEGTDEIAE